jgi:hypothetical protein
VRAGTRSGTKRCFVWPETSRYPLLRASLGPIQPRSVRRRGRCCGPGNSTRPTSLVCSGLHREGRTHRSRTTGRRSLEWRAVSDILIQQVSGRREARSQKSLRKISRGCRSGSPHTAFAAGRHGRPSRQSRGSRGRKRGILVFEIRVRRVKGRWPSARDRGSCAAVFRPWRRGSLFGHHQNLTRKFCLCTQPYGVCTAQAGLAKACRQPSKMAEPFMHPTRPESKRRNI